MQSLKREVEESHIAKVPQWKMQDVTLTVVTSEHRAEIQVVSFKKGSSNAATCLRRVRSTTRISHRHFERLTMPPRTQNELQSFRFYPVSLPFRLPSGASIFTGGNIIRI